MFPLFRRTVESIIVRVGGVPLDEFYGSENQRIIVQKENFEDLIIEKRGDLLLVGYYRKGDRKSDPIFAFEMRDNKWHPIRLEQVLMITEIGHFEQGHYYYYPRRFKDVKIFANACNREWRQYYL